MRPRFLDLFQFTDTAQRMKFAITVSTGVTAVFGIDSGLPRQLSMVFGIS